MTDPLAIQAGFSSARTTKDGGWNFTFETGETMGTKMAELAKLKDQRLYVVVMTEEQFEATRDEVARA